MPVCLEPSTPTMHSVGETLMTLAFTIFTGVNICIGFG